MSNQGGLKHVATEPTRLESKRERRRGASGRAAALRRAPSDSDCSGETASLSADSGDRAVRPAPQPPPRGKSRSRRRGSEWEVLEGLKDGQRFDKRPEVFNGYLHKKRKWPLKGWHKRFFVVDGGILVYARSPTDVARGRLHGSVDVGLSVISAKARRRRIDIDADEFIYHLRAKTPDVFRTWLTVLKAHRLYRQHLLTFGARESVPKIHAPLEDLPPTDTSSRTTCSNIEICTFSSFDKIQNITLPLTYIPCTIPVRQSSEFKSSVYGNKNEFSLNDWPRPDRSNRLLPLKFDELSDIDFGINLIDENKNYKSLNNVKTDCIPGNFSLKSKDANNKSPISLNTTDAEKQVLSTDLELSLRSPEFQSSILCEYYINTPNYKDVPNTVVKELQEFNAIESNQLIDGNKKASSRSKIAEPIATYCFSTHKISQNVDQSPMRRSRKSTNLVKYRNMCSEPPLRKPFNTYMLLGSYSNKLTKDPSNKTKCHQSAVCNIVSLKHIEIQVEIENNNTKPFLNTVTASDLDRITEKLMISIFDKMESSYDGKNVNIKSCINQVVKELYDSKITKNDTHPVIALFKSLLEYWLKNTSLESVRETVRRVKSIDRQSNKYFMKDKKISSCNIENVNKQTQFHGISDVVNQNISRILADIIRKKGKYNKARGPRISDNNSEKERRIQELERILKNTVYICETTRSKSVEKDIKITKTLIDHLENISQKSFIKKSDDHNNMDNSNSSSELPKIQDTINHLISETSLPLDLAKDFLGAYLDLLHNSKSSHTTSESTDNSYNDSPTKCDVQTESIQKKTSKGITTREHIEGDTVKPEKQNIDPGQLYLQNILEHITTLFCKGKEQSKIQNSDKQKDSECGDVKDELRQITYKNSVEIDLSHFNLEHVSMLNDSDAKDIMTITMKLKENYAVDERTKTSLLRLKFSKVNLKSLVDKISSKSNNDCPGKNTITGKTKVPETPFNENIFKKFELKPYSSSSEATSKDYCLVNSDNSLNFDFQNDHCRDIPLALKSLEDENETQSCYILSSLKCPFNGNKKNQGNDTADKNELTPKTTQDFAEELSIFEKSPKIIDENFILLLLENLTLLSKSLPVIHKDINGLYIRLRKKYDKIIKNQNTNIKIQGVGLLGKIYNDDINRCVKHNETQFDKSICCEENKDIAIETSDISCDKIISADKVKGQANTYIQTDEFICECCIKSFRDENYFNGGDRETLNTSTTQTFSSTSDKEEATKVEKAISNQNWYRKICTKDCGISTLMKYVLGKNESSRTFRIQPKSVEKQLELKIDTDLFPFKSLKRDNGKSNKIKNDLFKEITVLSRSFKATAQSQTEEQENLGTDFNVYELFSSGKYRLKKSSSLIEFNSEIKEKSSDLKTIYRCTSYPSFCSGVVTPGGAVRTQAGFVSGTPGGRLASWIIESGGPLESASRELGQAQLSVQQLQRLLDALELHQQTHHDTDVSLEGASPNVKKDRRKFGLRKKKSNSKCASVELAPPHVDPSASHMALSTLTAPPSPGGGASSIPNSAASLPIACAATRPQSLPGAEALNAGGPASITSLTPDHQLREDFTVLAKDLVGSLKSIVSTLVCERGRLRAAMEAGDASAAGGGSMMAALRTNLTTALHQNSELRARLARIHDTSDLADISSLGRNSELTRQFQQSLSYSSSCVSASEFFDAEEHEDDDFKPTEIIDADENSMEQPFEEEFKIIEIVDTDEAGVIELDGDSSSEAGSLSSEEGSASSDNSDAASIAVVPSSQRAGDGGGAGGAGAGAGGGGGWARRTGLPAPRPTPGGPSLWNLLYKNIGKDLSQISMPVTINEPLNMLQRLCEELEYSELLDAAAACSSAMERMALISAFAVSSYAAAAHRAASKPFNPLLAETYECVREDRAFRFVAEQVSHHPPISACHAESPRWVFWQEARIKTKFWGKSMEFQPAGRVHVRLLTTGDHYSWNKVTTCVHNLFGGQRWVDQYGDMHITCHGTDISCKLNFIKASSWSSSRHEVRGAVCGGGGGGARLRLAGRWSEALHAGDPPAARCLWRPGAMPPEHEMYYGFTRFAMELNELEPGMRDVLPHTDTRLRPDQRALEEGDVETAERLKHQLEQAQRERRRDRPDPPPVWFRKTTEGGEETWVFTGEYWRARDAGFPHNPAPRLW